MRICTVTVRRGATINKGNYESARLDLELSAEVDEDEDPKQVREILEQIIVARLEEQINALR